VARARPGHDEPETGHKWFGENAEVSGVVAAGIRPGGYCRCWNLIGCFPAG